MKNETLTNWIVENEIERKSLIDFLFITKATLSGYEIGIRPIPLARALLMNVFAKMKGYQPMDLEKANVTDSEILKKRNINLLSLSLNAASPKEPTNTAIEHLDSNNKTLLASQIEANPS